jgi:hypothetical protein
MTTRTTDRHRHPRFWIGRPSAIEPDGLGVKIDLCFRQNYRGILEGPSHDDARSVTPAGLAG